MNTNLLLFPALLYIIQAVDKELVTQKVYIYAVEDENREGGKRKEEENREEQRKEEYIPSNNRIRRCLQLELHVSLST